MPIVNSGMGSGVVVNLIKDLEGMESGAVYSSQYSNFNEAVVAATGKALVINTSIALTATLTTLPCSSLSVTSDGLIQLGGFNLTIDVPFQAGVYQCFDLNGSVSLPTIRAVCPEWWGADPTGVATSHAAIQAAIDSFGRHISPNPSLGYITRGVIEFGSGTYLVSETCYLNQQSISFNGNNTIIKWDGIVAGATDTRAIFNVQDSSRCYWDNIIFLGKTGYEPYAAIQFQSPTVGSLGTNELFVISKCIIGRRWIQDGLATYNFGASGSYNFQNGIVFDGASITNNDQWAIYDCAVHDCLQNGLYLKNSQSIWGIIQNTIFDHCGDHNALTGNAIYGGCNFQGVNVNFNRNVNDIYAIRDITVKIDNYNTENSYSLLQATQGAQLVINGGNGTANTNIGTYWATISGAKRVTLRDFRLLPTYSGGLTTALTYAGGSAVIGNLVIENCSLPNLNSGAGIVITANTVSRAIHTTIINSTDALLQIDCTENNTTTITSAGLFGTVRQGMLVTGTGINSGTYVETVVDSNTITLSNAATSTGPYTLSFADHTVTNRKYTTNYKFTYDPASLITGSGIAASTSSVALADITAGTLVVPSFSLDLQGILFCGGTYTTRGLSARFQNQTGSTIDLSSGFIAWMPIKNTQLKENIVSATWNISSLGAGNGVNTTFTVPGATLGDFVVLSHSGNRMNLVLNAYVSGANTVTARAQNYLGTTTTVTGTASVCILRPETATYRGTVTYDPPSLIDGAGITTTITVPGAKLGDFVIPSFSNDLASVMLFAYVSATNTVTCVFQNESTATVDLASGLLSVLVYDSYQVTY